MWNRIYCSILKSAYESEYEKDVEPLLLAVPMSLIVLRILAMHQPKMSTFRTFCSTIWLIHNTSYLLNYRPEYMEVADFAAFLAPT